MKKAVILFGSPHPHGATDKITLEFETYAQKNGFEVERFFMYKQNIKPCIGCYACQKSDTELACIIKDDLQLIGEKIFEADLLVLATPIHGAFCSAPLKMAMDRYVEMFNKFVGRPVEQWHSLWDGKKIVCLVTCGQPVEKITIPYQEAMKLLCDHSKMEYLGMYAERTRNIMPDDQWEDSRNQLIVFMKKVLDKIK